LACVVVAALLSGCATQRQTQMLCAALMGAAGAGGGAAIGSHNNSGNDAGAMAGGGGIGLAVGALAGWALCSMIGEKEVAQAEPPPPPPERAPPPPPAPPPIQERERIVLRGVNFEFDRAEVRADAAVILDEAARLLRENSDVRVRVNGHTDATGPEAYNQGLSERRAEAVKNHLVENGVSANRLSTQGLGESEPIASNDTREGRALNRRVELKVLD
jgi:OOP family OmpA-OmpF porin